ncbi:SPRY domain-containing SOCS box protein 3 [Polypterus senegalus]
MSLLSSAVTRGYNTEYWEWDPKAKSPAAQLSSNQLCVYFHVDSALESRGTAGVRGTKGFTHGEHYWEIQFLEPLYGTSVMVGVGTTQAQLHLEDYQFIDLLGMDKESWGLSYKGLIWHEGKHRKYTEPFYEKATIIGIHLNLQTGTLEFYKNGTGLGLAFSGLDKVGAPLYPLASSTSAETELQLGLRCWRFTSLKEHCLYAVLQHMKGTSHIDTLPLPRSIRNQLQAYKELAMPALNFLS